MTAIVGLRQVGALNAAENHISTFLFIYLFFYYFIPSNLFKTVNVGGLSMESEWQVFSSLQNSSQYYVRFKEYSS